MDDVEKISKGVNPYSDEPIDEDALYNDDRFTDAICRMYEKYKMSDTKNPNHSGEGWTEGEDEPYLEDYWVSEGDEKCDEIAEELQELEIDYRTLLSEIVRSNQNEEKTIQRSCDNCKLYKNDSCAGLNGPCEDYQYAPIITEEEKKNWPTEMGPYVTGYGRRKR